MTSAKDKAAEVCRKLGLPVLGTEYGYSAAYQIILKALQDYGQDREHAMRQACTNAISALPRSGFNGIDRISCDNARKACMNAKVE